MSNNSLRSRLLKSVPPLAPAAAAPGPATAAPTPPASSASSLAAPSPQATSAPKTSRRPAILVGVEKVHVWLRDEAKAILEDSDGKAKKLTAKSRELYEANGQRLHANRVPGEAISLTAFETQTQTYYAYRAALRYHAAVRGAQAVKDYNAASKAGDKTAAGEAWERVLLAAADLKTHPKSEGRTRPQKPTAFDISVGIESAPARAKREAKEKGIKLPPGRETAKLKAANAIAKKYPDWRERMWRRLVDIDSPWLDHTAVAALTGARPDELRTAHIRRENGGMVIGIEGAKVTAKSGQPWRKILLQDDGSPEYAHLFARCGAKWKQVNLPPGITDYPDAFSAALARAGQHALPGTLRMSGYVYRHAMASDLKADGFSREQIAMTLGHAVTKTQDAYGRAIGGVPGRRRLAVEAAREIKVTHDTRYTNPAPTPATPAAPEYVGWEDTPSDPAAGWSTPGFDMDSWGPK
jgi:hypothetical protein